MNARNMQVLQLIGAAVGEGASDGGCKWGAAALRERGIQQALVATGRMVTWGDTMTAQPLQASSRLDAIEAFSEELAFAVGQALRLGECDLALAGGANLIVAGEALSHCVANTVRDIASNFGEDNIKKLVLLTDCSSSVGGFEQLGTDFVAEMQARGMKTARSIDYML